MKDLLLKVMKAKKYGKEDDPEMKDVLTRLHTLLPPEVSYVPKGANGLPFLITKEDDVKVKALEKLLKTKLPNAVKIAKVLEDGTLEDADREAIQAVLQILSGLKDQVSDETLGELLALAEVPIQVAEGEGDGDPLMTEGEDHGDGEDVEAMKAKIMKLEEELVEAKKAMKTGEETEVDKETDELFSEEEVEVAKGLKALPIKKDGSLDTDKIPESVRGLVSSLWDQNKTTSDALAKVTKSLDEEREVRIKKAYDEKAQAYAGLGIEGLSEVLKEVGTNAPDSLEKFEAVLKVANDAVSGSRNFTEIGASTGFTDDGSNPDFLYKQIEDKAVQVYKGEEGGKSKATLVTKFTTDHPEGRRLYSQYLKRLRNVRG